MRYLVVGAGPAGVIAAETLRNTDPGGEVVLLGGEPEPAYSRMAIPYYLAGSIGEPGTYLRPEPDHFSRARIDFRHDRLLRLDAAAGLARLAKGGATPFDRLLIATGSSPAVPPVPGLTQPGIHTCWTLADARAIAAAAKPGARVVLVGAGFIGCIILEALVERGVQLTVVEQAPRMVARMMNDVAAGMIKQRCEQNGVEVLTDTLVDGVAERGDNGEPFKVHLKSGRVLEADLVITATGVRPNLEFLEGSGIETGQGVLVDETLRTSVPHVYAAGDVAEGRDFSTGGQSVHAIQPTASEHGRIAALNMAGVESAYTGSLIMNVLDTLGLISCSFGRWDGVADGEEVALRDDVRQRYLQLQFADDVLVGANSVGMTQHVGVLRGLIQGRFRLGVWKRRLQADPTRVMEAYLACAGSPLPVGGAQ